MKKKITLLASLFILSISTTFAQCTPDCPNSTWTSYSYANVTTSCGNFLVEYVTRFACNMYYDIQILSIEVLDYNNSTCSDIEFQQVINSVILQLLIDNPMGFPPNSNYPNPNCVENWRVLKGGCWTKTYHGGVPKSNTESNKGDNELQGEGDFKLKYGDEFRPCGDLPICCLEYFKVCYDIRTQQRVITNTGYLPGPTLEECDPYKTGRCFPMCGTIYRP